MRNIGGSEAISSSSAYRIDSRDRVAGTIKNVIADHKPMMANEDDSVKIMQTEEAREEKSTRPERIRNPGIQVVIVPRRRIVCDNRGAFLIVVVVYCRRVRLGLVFSVLAGTAGHNGQPELSCEIFKCFQRFDFFHWQLFGICCSDHSVLQLTNNIGCDRVIGDPTISWRDSD
jgi:hypothetical protein